ncbi:uncharacterized protein LOC103716329 [Phoenix dactylifera]|uniref:Uncharacterized protein LOC103716329 n=1 Tax=Phoenix dactylifera TaxID=42345 RepID=A0A8B8ZCX6_PHODC|nr:uncharacterized protein LOC103716329 [Phoenix dactylifera]
MAEPNPPLHPSKLPTPKYRTPNPPAQQSSARFLSSFLYKVIFVTVFIALLPLFPSQAPESVNQSIFTRSWELLHLLIVGIAISYGLFSRRNTEPEPEKEAAWKVDSPQSYISQILHVSSDLDDDEVDSPHGPLDESKIQTWSSQYYPNNPVVVVKKGWNRCRPCNQDSGLLDSCNEFIDGHSGSVNGIEESRNFDALNSKNVPEGRAVLPSPIPWRSRSGRMEVKDESASGTGSLDLIIKRRNEAEIYSVGRSVRTVRAKDVPSTMPDRATKIGGAEQSFGYEPHQPPPIPKYQAEKENEFIMEKVIVSSDESDADDAASEASDHVLVSNPAAEAAPEANEVDKKADEFIAKFREQIRLQRIESIKRSTGQRGLRNPK